MSNFVLENSAETSFTYFEARQQTSVPFYSYNDLHHALVDLINLTGLTSCEDGARFWRCKLHLVCSECHILKCSDYILLM